MSPKKRTCGECRGCKNKKACQKKNEEAATKAAADATKKVDVLEAVGTADSSSSTFAVPQTSTTEGGGRTAESRSNLSSEKHEEMQEKPTILTPSAKRKRRQSADSIDGGERKAAAAQKKATPDYKLVERVGRIDYVRREGGNEDEQPPLYAEVRGVMSVLYGRAGTDLWEDTKTEIPRVETHVQKTKGLKIILDLNGLERTARILPVIGTKRAALLDVWKRLGGEESACPMGTDSFGNAEALRPLARMFQVEPDRIMQLRRKHALTPEEKGVLTIDGEHKQLFALVDVAMIVTGKNQNDAAEQVRNIP